MKSMRNGSIISDDFVGEFTNRNLNQKTAPKAKRTKTKPKPLLRNPQEPDLVWSTLNTEVGVG